MMTWIMIAGAVLALGIGIWIGLGAPGWPIPPGEGGRLQKRSINPIAWGRGSGRDRPTPRRRDDRRPRLR